MKEFQSQLEQLLPAKELLFDATPGFGNYKPFLEQSISHPAKMNTHLTEYLIRTLTKEGDVVLDPMSGSGQTGVIAVLLGRDAICLELEEKFHNWQKETLAILNNHSQLPRKGKMSCVLGDARKLGELLKAADVILTSPPYHSSRDVGTGLTERGRMILEKTQGRQYSERSVLNAFPYSSNPLNIGNLAHGEIDAVITSPPYGAAQDGRGIAVNGYQGSKHSPTDLIGQRSYIPDKFETEGNISNLPFGSVDAVITSPPYAIDPKNVCHTKDGKTLEDYDKKRGFEPTVHARTNYSTNPANIGHLPEGDIDAIITSPPYSEGIGHPAGENASPEHKERLEMQRKYTEQMSSEGNIGSLKHGEVDAVISSPPYSEMMSIHGGGRQKRTLAGTDKLSIEKSLETPYSNNISNIGNLKHGEVDVVITSPPYEESLGSKHHNPRADKISKEKSLSTTYTEREKIDAVITSPPYEDTQHFQDMEFMKKITEDQNKKLETGLNTGHAKSVEAANRSFRVMAHGSLENKNNIGNLKKETYLSAMLTVYSEMFNVLKPNGLAVIIVKPFIRNKAVIDLPYQTWLLMQKCGFNLIKLFKLRLTQQSFWRILYQKKHPEVDVIAHEYVLVCKK